MLIIHHTEPRTHTFQLSQVPLMQNGKPVFEVHPKSGEKTPVLRDRKPITLMPGMNALPRDDYEIISSLDAYKSRLEDGVFEEVYEGETLPNDPTLLEHIFAHTVDVALLRQWMDEYEDELPSDLRELIEDQIMKVTNPKEFAKREDQRRAIEGRGGKKSTKKLREKKKLSDLNKRKTIKKRRSNRRADFDMDDQE